MSDVITRQAEALDLARELIEAMERRQIKMDNLNPLQLIWLGRTMKLAHALLDFEREFLLGNPGPGQIP